MANNQCSYAVFEKDKEIIPFPANYLELTEKYFMAWFAKKKMEPTYIIFNSFKNMLFNAFKSFSESPYLFITNFQ